MKELANLTPEQRKLMALLLQEAGSGPGQDLPIAKRPDPHQAPLSSAQQRMWLAYRQSPDDVSYNIQTAMRITGKLDVAALNQALSELVKRHEALRTSFEVSGESGGEILQWIHPAKPVTLAVTELDDPSAVAEFVQAQAAAPWDLQAPDSLRITLIRCAPDEHVLLLGMHHILSDAWSVAILRRELWQIYDAIVSNQPIDLPQLTTTYGDHAHWEQQAGSASEQASSDFWADALRDAPTLLHLPLDRARHQSQTKAASILNWQFAPQTAASVRELAQANRCSTFAVCLAGFYLLLGELTGNRDVLVACPVASRERAELEQTIGYFSNTVVMRGQWSASTSFNDLVQQVHELSLEALAHQGFAFERIVEEAKPRRVHGIHPLAQVFFAFQQYAPDGQIVQKLQVKSYEQAWRSTQFDIEMHAWETPDGGIEATLIYPDLIEPASATHWAQRWCDILESACAQPLVCASTWIQPRSEVPPALSDAELCQQIKTLLEQSEAITGAAVMVDQTPVALERLAPQDLYDPPQAASPHRRSNERSTLAPAAPPPSSHAARIKAMITGDQPTPDLPVHDLASLLVYAAHHHPNASLRFVPDNSTLRLPELLERARQIQTSLQAAGVKTGDLLLFQLESEQDVITYFWATVFAGAKPLIQLPVHPEQPQLYQQLVAVWDKLERPKVLVCAATEQTWRDLKAQVIDIATCTSTGSNAEQTTDQRRPSIDDIAFFSLSSGTSGLPKAIPLTHRNVLSRAFAARDFTGIDHTRVLLSWQPLSHIACISDWHIRGLCAGAHMIYGHNTDVLVRPTLWLDWIEQHAVTDTWAPNFAYNRLLTELKQPENLDRRWNLAPLKLCLSAGESIAPGIMDELEDRLADSGFGLGVIQPAFGMAETASGVTYCSPDPHSRIKRHRLGDQMREYVSCGQAIAGVSVRVTADHGDLLDEDQIGHIEFKGDPVFSGYHNAADINRSLLTTDGWFRSGDLGFIHEGCLYVTGRSKAEINVNGRKLSCETMEMAIGALPDVVAGEVAVFGVATDNPETEEVVVFFVPQSMPLSPERWRTIRGFITQTFGVMPAHLLPVAPSAIARTALGKIRRQVLSTQFAAGEFDDLVQQHANYQATQQLSIPNSFYQKHWRRYPLTGLVPRAGTLCIVSTGSALSERLAQRLTHAGFEVQPLETAARNTKQPLQVLDITRLETSQPASDTGRAVATAEHLRTLLQQLKNLCLPQCDLTVVTCLTQVTGREAEVRVEDAVAHGLLKSAAQEFASWLACRHIDLDVASDAMQADVLMEELCAPVYASEVVYRQQRRYVPHLKKTRIKRTAKARALYDGTGFVVISGGLGGIGRLVAKHLHDTYGLYLLLLGRSEPSASEARFLADHQRLTYARVDVADAELVKQTVAAHEKRLNQTMAGVIHLAGNGSWQDQIANSAQYRLENLHASDWAAQFDAKVTGTCNLFKLVRARPGASFVATSSVIGEFGGASFAGYAAANSFLSAFCRAQTQQGHPATFCHQWSPWLDTGMSQGQAPEYASVAGYLSLTPQSGLHILMASLSNGVHDLTIGLDPNHARVRAHQPITAYYTCQQREAASRYVEALASLPWLIEREGLVFSEVHELPDQTSGAGTGKGTSHAQDTSQTELKLQAQLSQLLRDVMELDHVELDDNFFELGAHSLLMVTIEARIKVSISDQIELLDLFRFPTVRRLARHLALSQSPVTDTSTTNTVNHDKVINRTAQASTQSRLRSARANHRRGRPS